MLDISLAILSGAFLVLVLFSLPFLFQIWKAAKSITRSVEILNQRLPAILKNVEETTANVNRATMTVNAQVEALSQVVQKFQGVLAVLTETESILRGRLQQPVLRSMSTILAAVKGIGVFWRVFRHPEESPRR
jgi:uncharacterized protein YoxC